MLWPMLDRHQLDLSLVVKPKLKWILGSLHGHCVLEREVYSNLQD